MQAMTRVHQVGLKPEPAECTDPIAKRRTRHRASELSRKDIQNRTMKTMKKSFTQSLREQLREGMILYAAANTCAPYSVDLMHLYQETINEEMN